MVLRFGRAEGVLHQAGRGWNAGCGDLPEGGISQATYFSWKKEYAGLLPTEMKRLKRLEDENARLKKIVVDLTLDREMVSV